MERNLRIAAPIAGGAVVISLFVALFAGVPFGTALLRAVLSGGAFGVLSFGVVLVAQTQLPGFGGTPAASDAGGTASSGASSQAGGGEAEHQSGSRLNIVVEDDYQPGESGADSRAVTDTGADTGADTGVDTDAAQMDEEPETVLPGDEESKPPRPPVAEQETGDWAPASAGIGSAEPVSADGAAAPYSSDDEDDQVEELVEEVEESSADDEEAVMKAAISEEQDGTSVEIDDTMLDEMPDIGSFAGSFASGGDSESEETGDAMGGPGTTGTFSGGTKQKKGDPRKGFDNKSIAKALQTFMAKDSE